MHTDSSGRRPNTAAGSPPDQLRTDGSGGVDTEPLDSHWWGLVRLCAIVPLALFGLGMGIEFGGASLLRSVDVSPIVRMTAGLFALSVPACSLVFVVAASRDKRFLDERTGDARPRHPVVVAVFLSVTAGGYALYYVLRRRQKYGRSRTLVTVGRGWGRWLRAPIVGAGAVIGGVGTDPDRSSVQRRASDGSDGSTADQSDGSSQPHGGERRSGGEGQSSDGDEDDAPREAETREAADGESGEIDLRNEPPVESPARTSLTLTYEGTRYRCTAIAPNGERWGIAWGTSGEAEASTRLFTLQWGARHATIATGDVSAGTVADDGAVAVVERVDDEEGDAGTRVRAFTRDGTERFTRRVEGRVGSPVVAPAARYVGVVARDASRLVVFDAETGDRLVDRQRQKIPADFAFRRHGDDWWIVGGDAGSPPSLAIRLSDGELVR